jgi:hypothetical protein
MKVSGGVQGENTNKDEKQEGGNAASKQERGDLRGWCGAIGGAVARAFAREGASVFLAGSFESVAREISAAGGTVETAQVDHRGQELPYLDAFPLGEWNPAPATAYTGRSRRRRIVRGVGSSTNNDGNHRQAQLRRGGC